MSQLRTHSNKYDLSAVFFNMSMLDWVRVIHSTITTQYEMSDFNIEPTDFGFDSYVYILNALLPHISMTDIMASIKGNLNVEHFVEMSHQAWCNNYIYWKGELRQSLGTNPKKTLNTHCRNDRATTNNIEHLNECDRKVYIDVIKIVFDTLTTKVLESGMKSLSIE